jgi:tyrosinase
MVFITHHPEGRKLPIPSLEQRTPQWVRPSNTRVGMEGIAALGALGAEAKLDYFREDTAVNDHHGKWHVVYPAGGHPDPANPNQFVTKDRQGELFWYMHQQMLARYDTERRAFGLARVLPIENYRNQLAEGYIANLQEFSDRRANAVLHDLPTYTVAQHETSRDRLVAAGKAGKLQQNGAQVNINPSLLGDSIEANADTADRAFYGNLHNMGHVLISDLRDPNGAFPDQRGVMISTATAVRDPIFFRWHKHVDNLFVVWQSKLPANDFTTDAPPVRLRKQLDGSNGADQSPDIIFCRATALPNWGKPDFDGQKLGEDTFGGGHWDRPTSEFPAATDELGTFMKEEQVPMPDGSTVKKPFLDHDEFVYYLRLENVSDQQQRVTVRVFIALTELAKPPRPPGAVDMNYCDCGWHLHVYLPRGTENGMDFVAFVMLTDFEQDMVGAEKKCGSMSFCGARDAKYPDNRAMGYPFDRPFTGKSIAETVAAQQNMATRKFKIKHGQPV